VNDAGHRKVVHMNNFKARIPQSYSPSVTTWHAVVDQHSHEERGGGATAELPHSSKSAEDAGESAQHGTILRRLQNARLAQGLSVNASQ